MTERRNQVEIIFDILKAVQDKGGVIKPTHLLYKSNLSHKRLKEYMDDLSKKGMLEEQSFEAKKMIAITDHGRKFIEEYQKVREFTSSFGL